MTPSGDRLPLEGVLDAVCLVALLMSVLWLLAVIVVALAAEVACRRAPASARADRLDRLADRRCPVAVRRLVAAAVGAALVVGSAGPALAHARPGPGPATADVVGLALPDRTVGSALATAARPTLAAAASRTVPSHAAGVLVVRPGDCLWTLAAGLLGPGSSDRAITAAWHRLRDANPDRIGPDPDLILPGTRLRVPDLTTPSRKAVP
jgi:nucleoid-associated protein YgaU